MSLCEELAENALAGNWPVCTSVHTRWWLPVSGARDDIDTSNHQAVEQCHENRAWGRCHAERMHGYVTDYYAAAYACGHS